VREWSDGPYTLVMARRSSLAEDWSSVVMVKDEVELLIKLKEEEGQAVRRPPREPVAGQA